MKNMKYLLRLLGAVTLTGLSVTTLAACGTEKVTSSFDLSTMKAENITATTKNILAVNPKKVIATEVIDGIMPSILECVNRVSNKSFAKDDFIITLKSTPQGAEYKNLDLDKKLGKTYVKIAASNKTNALSKETELLGYALPYASEVTDLAELTVNKLTIVKSLYARKPEAVKEKEIIDGIISKILVDIKGLKHNNSINEKDFTVKISSAADGKTPIATIDLRKTRSAKERTIYVKVLNTGNSDVIKETATWLEYALPGTEPTVDLGDAITIPNLKKILYSTDAILEKNVLLAINKLNPSTLTAVPLTMDDVIIAINSDKQGATVTGKGKYHDSVPVTFTTIEIKLTELGNITPALGIGTPLVDTDVLKVIIAKNLPAATGLRNTTDVVIVIDPNNRTATVTGANDYTGVISVTFHLVRNDISTGVSVADPKVRIAAASTNNSELLKNTDIQKAVIAAITTKHRGVVTVYNTDFILTVEKDNKPQATGPIEFTVTAQKTSILIQGQFKFKISLLA